jgi:hypothetical protein
MGWCYGFTAADLMTHFRFKQKQISLVNEQTMVSALGVSANYNHEFYRYYAPEKELLKSKIEKEDQVKLQEQKTQDTKRQTKNRINYPGFYRAKDYLISVNPFSKTNLSHSVPKNASSPTVISKQTSVTSQILPAAKKMSSGDLIAWENIKDDREYAMTIRLTDEARKKIIDNLCDTKNLYEAQQAYLQTLRELTAKDFKEQGVKPIPFSGYISSAIESSKKNYCTENEARSGDLGIEHFDLQAMLELIFDNSNNKEKITCDFLTQVHKMLPKMNLNEIANIVKHSQRSQTYEILVENSCKHKLSPDFKEPEVLGWTIPKDYLDGEVVMCDAQKELLKKIDKVLDQGTPVGINYYNDFLTNTQSKHEGPHASSVVGKRINPVSCEEEYILRNSYGSGCAYYKKHNTDYVSCVANANRELKAKNKMKMKSECDKKNITTFSNPKISCDENSGYLYVSKMELGKNLYGITFLKE